MRRLGGLIGLATVFLCPTLLHAQAVDSTHGVVSDQHLQTDQPIQSAQPVDSLRPIIKDSTGQEIPPGRPTVHSVGTPVDESKWPDPTVTLFKSMLVPGWGQITNKAYFKAGLAIGLETWFLTNAIINNTKMNDALDAYHAEPGNLDHYYDYQYYHGLRSDYLWGLGITVFISMFDAYVDAHLRPYDDDTIPGVEPPEGLILDIPF